jgi:hypothetical protein
VYFVQVGVYDYTIDRRLLVTLYVFLRHFTESSSNLVFEPFFAFQNKVVAGLF